VNDRPIKVMLFDDHALVRQGIIALLRMHPEIEVIGEAGDGDSALAVYRRGPPDVALVDLRMPGRGGVEVIRALRSEFPGSRFLVLTTYSGEADVSRALAAGARGYVLKDASRTTLIDAIKHVHGGGRYIPADIADRILPSPGDAELSDRELDVLRLVARGMRNKDIADRLGITERTVKFHMNAVLAKLGAADRTQALVEALRRGLVHIE
jgi:DNA-binding NarL/FixJ family response regulator